VIDAGHYFAFLGVSLLVICTPGQGTALTIRNTLLMAGARSVVRGASNAKAKRELGWMPEHSSWRRGFLSAEDVLVSSSGSSTRRKLGSAPARDPKDSSR
jgi:hypothetical protein